MAEQETVEIKSKKRFDQRDWDHIADFIYQTYEDRKRKRAHLEKVWKEVDRQIRLEPKIREKKQADGKPNQNDWMPEMELPHQAIAHEILKSDARRMMFPDNGPWFKAYAGIDDKILSAYQNHEFIQGEDIKPIRELAGGPRVDQEDINMVVQSYIEANHSQYDFTGHWDLLNGESFKYGTGVGRGRMVTKNIIARTAQGAFRQNVAIPVIVPRSIKNVYLDDNKASVMNEGHMISQGDIECRSMRIDDLRLAANKGSTNIKDMNGGWMPAMLKDIEGDEKGLVHIVEYEGDLVVPRKTTGNMVLYNYIITVMAANVDGGKDGGARRVIRCRVRDISMPSFIVVPYDREHVDSAYGVGPLMKGYPIQMAASEALNRTLAAAALDTEPPIRYDQDDAMFSQQGGPQIFPGSQIATMGQIDVLKIGTPAAMLAAYQSFSNQYADLTGMTGPRLGQQTNSHTTAYAKGSEMERGQVRTVDYVRSTLGGPMKQWLHLEYEMGRKNLDKPVPVFLNAVKMFVNVEKPLLPETVYFEVFGSSGPAEDTAKAQMKLSAIQLAMNIDQIKVQMGLGEPLNYEEIQKQILKEGGIEDVERFNIKNTGGHPPTPVVPGTDQGAGMSGAASTALQGINFGQNQPGY